jgi:hypothetical protein
MDHDTSFLTKLKEEASLRRRHLADSQNANAATCLKIKMIVSTWYTDELGNRARIIKACE